MRSGVVNDSSSGYVNYPKTIILPSAQICASSGENVFTDFDISHLLELTRCNQGDNNKTRCIEKKLAHMFTVTN